MHSCEVVPTPPAQGAALLLELGTLIVEGRSASRDPIRFGDDASRGAPPKRPAHNNNNSDLSSPAKRNREKPQPHFEEEPSPSTSECLSVYDLKALLVGRIPLRGRTEALWRDHTPLCIEVLLAPNCSACRDSHLLLERWTMSVYSRRNKDGGSPITSQWLLNAVRSQLHFSQISAWNAKLKEVQEQQAKAKKDLSPAERQRKLSREMCNFKKYEANCDQQDVVNVDGEKDGSNNLNIVYNLKIPDENYKASFQRPPTKHTFPLTDIGNNVFLEMTLESLPRLEEIPTISCLCSAKGNDSAKRRKSKDHSVEANVSEDILARKLAVACSLGELCNVNRQKIASEENEDPNNKMKRSTHSPDLGAINSETGCGSGMSRKFPLYSSPNTPEFSFQPVSSRGSTPERSDFNDSGFSCSKTNSEHANGEPTVFQAAKEASYQIGVVSSARVPSDSYLQMNYLVDDRMQTPCSQKGKHRCNCDEESDQGIKESNRPSNEYLDDGYEVLTRDSEIINIANADSNVQNASKELPKYSRKHRKEPRHKHMSHHAQFRDDNSQTKGPSMSRKDKNSDLISNRKTRTCSSSDNSDGRCSPELVHYGTACQNCHGCVYKHQGNLGAENDLSEQSARKSAEGAQLPSTTTSIPILQASKFDHVNRFGNFRSALHKSVSNREFSKVLYHNGMPHNEHAKLSCCCQSREHCSSHLSSLENNNVPHEAHCSGMHSCFYENGKMPPSKKSVNDDDYRPSAKKLISSYTQTDDNLCECGRPLIPVCFECSSNGSSENLSPNRGDILKSKSIKMKRSEANHNLAAFNKSAISLAAIERSNGEVTRSPCDSPHVFASIGHNCVDEKIDGANGKKVIDINCDNRFSTKNNYKCDNNRLCDDDDRIMNCSRNKKDSNSYKTPFLSDADCDQTNYNFMTRESILSKSDLNVNSQHKASGVNKIDSFIRKPKLKRYASVMDKVDKIILDRKKACSRKAFFSKRECTEEKSRKEQNCELTPPNRVRADNERLKRHKTARNISESEENIIIHEKGDYGTFGKIIDDENDPSKNDAKNAISKAIATSDHNFVPSVSEMDKFRCILDSAASMVFHSRTGLPLTSSPAPLRRGKSSFDFDSSINSVSGIKSALYGSSDIETADLNPAWSPGSSPGSPSQIQLEAPIFDYSVVPKNHSQSISANKQNKFRHGTSSGLLGNFEESVLNGRLEPAATVAGFTAEIGASGEFCPPHLTLPVTVFFYSLGDNTTSSPYLGHINLGRKGYCVPRTGTIQVTLFNPHGTVVKMFVVMYDLEDMPPHSRTFLRQRTLWGGTCLRYLIHLRFLTSKSGKVYLHTDIRIIVSRKADLDTAAAHSLTSAAKILSDPSEQVKKRGQVETGTFERRSRIDSLAIEKRRSLNRSVACYELSNCCENRSKCDTILSNIKNKQQQTNSVSAVISKELSYELRSFTYGPENPKYSPR